MNVCLNVAWFEAHDCSMVCSHSKVPGAQPGEEVPKGRTSFEVLQLHAHQELQEVSSHSLHDTGELCEGLLEGCPVHRHLLHREAAQVGVPHWEEFP